MEGRSGSRPIVVKIGGSTLGSHDTTLKDLVALHQEGYSIAVVHGGGSVVSDWMKRQGSVPRFVRGLRVTDSVSLEIATAVLAGLINKQLVASLLSLGAKAIGLSGVDGGMLECQIANPELGFVGEVTKVDPGPIYSAMKDGYMPVISPIGIHSNDGSEHSSCLLNINGDTAAGHLARAIQASHLIFMTDVPAVLDGAGRPVSRLSIRGVRMFLRSGIARGGMIPKLEACLEALPTVPIANIIDGRQPGALQACFQEQGNGTRIHAKD
ncbi:acetylglutamate kinase [SAR202 cluster bacterium AD-804-J14_MRT_500m]|nr:acetylglutamate kinase [SAR202 cluster bacterium AD-804-J14_MRT_500m]